MLKKLKVTTIIKEPGFYSPHVATDEPSYAALPNELIDDIHVGDEITVFSDSNLTYGGFEAIVIATPTANIADKIN